MSKVNVSIYMYVPRFLTNSWHMTLPSTEKLIALPCAYNLKVESMIKLAAIFGAKKKLQLSLSMWWNNPPITGQSVNRQSIRITCSVINIFTYFVGLLCFFSSFFISFSL